MPTPEEWATEILNRVEQLVGNVQELLAGSFTLADLGHLVNAVLQAAESIWQGPGQGADKRAAVLATFQELENRYHWQAAIDKALKLPAPLEWVDNMLMPLIQGLLVDLIVAVLNATGAWGLSKFLAARNAPVADPEATA